MNFQLFLAGKFTELAETAFYFSASTGEWNCSLRYPSHCSHLSVKYRPVWCICGSLFMIIIWCSQGNSRRCRLIVCVPRGFFTGDAFFLCIPQFFFRCATTSQRALLYGNQIEKGKGPPLKIKLENLSLCMRFTANSSWSTHPKPEHIHVLELWFWYFLSL